MSPFPGRKNDAAMKPTINTSFRMVDTVWNHALDRKLHKCATVTNASAAIEIPFAGSTSQARWP